MPKLGLGAFQCSHLITNLVSYTLHNPIHEGQGISVIIPGWGGGAIHHTPLSDDVIIRCIILCKMYSYICCSYKMDVRYTSILHYNYSTLVCTCTCIM